MKTPCVLAAGLCLLASCKKGDSFPARIDAAFNQQVTLRYQQGAALPNQSAPELTITVDDVQEMRCPSEVTCLQPGEVVTVLGIQDRNGAGQPVTVRLDGLSVGNDSAAVQANGRNYTIVLKEVTPYPIRSVEPKERSRVVLIVRRR